MTKISFIFLLFMAGNCLAQLPAGWRQVNEISPKVKVSIPDKDLVRTDTLGLISYLSKTSDTLISSQVFIYNNYSFSGNTELIDYMILNSETDTLDIVARYILSLGGELIYKHNQYYAGTHNKILDLGVKHSVQLADNNVSTFITYTRLYLWNRRMITISMSAQEAYLNPLLAARNRVWNSIICY